MKDKIKAYLKLSRVGNALIAMLVVFVGVKASVGFIPFLKTLCLSLSMFFLNVFSNIQNDIVDVEIDKINRKERPIVKGSVSEDEAAYLAIFSLIVSLVFAIFCGLGIFLMALLMAILVYLYNTYLKKVLLLSNITVALITALVFIIAGMLVKATKYAFMLGLIAFYYNFMREIIKDWADIEGDKSAGIQTVPMVLGDKLTGILIVILSFFFIPFLLIPYVAGLFKTPYLYIGIGFCAVPLFASFFLLKKDKEGLYMYSKVSKYLMLSLLLAIYLGV